MKKLLAVLLLVASASPASATFVYSVVDGQSVSFSSVTNTPSGNMSLGHDLQLCGETAVFCSVNFSTAGTGTTITRTAQSILPHSVAVTSTYSIQTSWLSQSGIYDLGGGRIFAALDISGYELGAHYFLLSGETNMQLLVPANRDVAQDFGGLVPNCFGCFANFDNDTRTSRLTITAPQNYNRSYGFSGVNFSEIGMVRDDADKVSLFGLELPDDYALISVDNGGTPGGSGAVPEPAMLGLFGMGAIGLGLSRRRKAA